MDSSLLLPLALALAAAVLPFYLIADLRVRRSRKELREQNILFDTALGNMAQGLNVLDSAGRLMLTNERYLEMYGLSRAAVKPGVTVRELVDLRLAAGTFFKTDPSHYTNALMASIVDRKPTQAVHELADGRVINVTNLPMANGGWVVTHKDVTERWQAERELEKTRNFLHSVIENVPAIILVKDASDLSYVLINREGERHFGIPREQMIGRTSEAMFPKESAAAIAAHDREALDTNREFFDEHPIELPGGGRYIVTSRRVRIPGKDGEPGYLLRHPGHHRAQARRSPDRLRLAHRPAQPRRLQSMFCGGAGTGGQIERKLRGAERRSRPLQGDQRRVRAFDRRSPAAGGGATPERDARRRVPGPHRRRRIRRHRHREPGTDAARAARRADAGGGGGRDRG
jgi:PAS domain-containing protein